MWHKYIKQAVYTGIPIVCFLILFFHPKNYKAERLLDVVAKPVGFFQTPVFELKKLFFYRETWDDYIRYKKQNEILKAKLMAITENLRRQDRSYRIQDFRESRPYNSVVANVIGRDPSNWNASLIVDKGQEQGVLAGQPVVTPLGVVGRVFEAGKNTAKVILLSDPGFAVAAVVERSRENGLLTGTLQGQLRFQYLTEKADVKVGDNVVTSRLSRAFPSSILIGQITDVLASVNTHTVECSVTPAVDLSELEEVIVIIKDERY
ncbi:MAG: rod shape-determining protein MreC [Candidatus Omnitrophica bacterium]|nr:rod shape-determining protein MreC [Candidatus Omnitrophota bacterium]